MRRAVGLVMAAMGLSLMAGLAAPVPQALAAAAHAGARSPQAATPSPSWWSGNCDVNNHPGSHPLGASYNGVEACGPGPLQGGYDHLVRFFSGAWGEYEWECVELVMRYMYLVYGIHPYGANGSTVVGNYSGSVLTRVSNNGSSLPIPGDIVSEGAATTNGHTGVVTNVNVANGKGTVTIMEQNATSNGWGSIPVSGNVLGSGVTGWLHHKVSTPAAPAVIGVLTSTAEALAKEGGLSAQWVDEYGGVSQVAVASDPTNGPLIAVLTTNGTVLAKEGGLSAQWVTEYNGASQVAVASDPTNGPLIAVLTGSTALAKEGGLSAQWVTEYNGASQVAVASDPVHGPLIGIMSGTSALAKHGGLSAQWVTEYNGASQIAVASDPTNGPLIAVLTGSTALAKEGGLSAQWVTEYNGASQIAVASDPTNGPLIAVLTGSTALAKEGGLSAQWVAEYNGASQVAVAG
jgi:CHAP domain-containing protein